MTPFDDLIDDMALGQLVKSSNPALADRLLPMGGDALPHVRREALAATGGAPSSSGPAWPVAVFRPRQATHVRENGEHSAQDLDGLCKALDATIAARPVLAQVETREERIARVRATATDVLAKAMVGFEAGTISAQQVNYLETVCGNMVQAHVEARS